MRRRSSHESGSISASAWEEAMPAIICAISSPPESGVVAAGSHRAAGAHVGNEGLGRFQDGFHQGAVDGLRSLQLVDGEAEHAMHDAHLSVTIVARAATSQRGDAQLL